MSRKRNREISEEVESFLSRLAWDSERPQREEQERDAALHDCIDGDNVREMNALLSNWRPRDCIICQKLEWALRHGRQRTFVALAQTFPEVAGSVSRPYWGNLLHEAAWMGARWAYPVLIAINPLLLSAACHGHLPADIDPEVGRVAASLSLENALGARGRYYYRRRGL
jgi:hypothetical protein